MMPSPSNKFILAFYKFSVSIFLFNHLSTATQHSVLYNSVYIMYMFNYQEEIENKIYSD